MKTLPPMSFGEKVIIVVGLAYLAGLLLAHLVL
jgi:hypothetical protein